MRKQGQGEGVSPWNGIQIQRRVLAYPVFLDTVSPGTRDGARNFQSITLQDSKDGEQATWETNGEGKLPPYQKHRTGVKQENKPLIEESFLKPSAMGGKRQES